MLKGNIALVTGGGSGIGRATCQLFAEEGATVVAADIDRESVLQTVQSLPGDDHLPLELNVSLTEDIDRGLAEIRHRFSCPPTITVNCAGLLSVGSFLDLTEDEFYKLIDVNLKVKHPAARNDDDDAEVVQRANFGGRSGSIVNMSSVAAPGCRSLALYAATKAAIDSFSKSAALEMAKHNIRINSVQPGLVKTPMADQVPEKILQTYVPKSSFDHPADPREIAEVILFLSSDRASYVSGSTFSVFGARS